MNNQYPDPYDFSDEAIFEALETGAIEGHPLLDPEYASDPEETDEVWDNHANE